MTPVPTASIRVPSLPDMPVTASFLTGPPGAGAYDNTSLGSLRIDWLAAAFLLLALRPRHVAPIPGRGRWAKPVFAERVYLVLSAEVRRTVHLKPGEALRYA